MCKDLTPKDCRLSDRAASTTGSMIRVGKRVESGRWTKITLVVGLLIRYYTSSFRPSSVAALACCRTRSGQRVVMGLGKRETARSAVVTIEGDRPASVIINQVPSILD